MIELVSIPLPFLVFLALLATGPFVLLCYGLWVFGGWVADKIDQRRWPRS